MSIPDPNLAALGQLEPRQLLELLDQLDPTDHLIAELDIDAVLGTLDPGKLNREELVHLVSRLNELAAAGADLDLSKASPQNFARLVTRASKDQIEGLLSQPQLRGRILDEIFRRMTDHYRSERAASVKAVVHWRLTGGSDEGGYDRYESIMENGTCDAHHERTREPRVTVTLNPADFLKLVTSNASAPMLFLTGKLKVKGDLAFAAGMVGLFDLPRA
ncbi:MAG: SCP2 sterol-binding domain-containing protein [Sciscionella sp.]